MLFASVGSDAFFGTMLLMAIVAFFLKKFLTKNPDVGSAANDAAKNTALALIQRIFKR